VNAARRPRPLNLTPRTAGGGAVPRAAWLLSCLWFCNCWGLTTEPLPQHDARGQEMDLVRQVLAERLVAEDLPDLELVRHGDQVVLSPIVSVPGGNLVLNPEHLPRIPGWTFRLLDRDGARLEADATRHDVFYLELAVSTRSGDSATVWFGVQMVMPSDSTATPMCCCERSARFTKVDEIWRFAGWDRGTCI